MPLKRDISNVNDENSPITNGVETNGLLQHDESQLLDMLIVGAGFAGVYLLHQLRKRGFNAKIVEVFSSTWQFDCALVLILVCAQAGSDLGGIWYWNRYVICGNIRRQAPETRCHAPASEHVPMY